MFFLSGLAERSYDGQPLEAPKVGRKEWCILYPESMRVAAIRSTKSSKLSSSAKSWRALTPSGSADAEKGEAEGRRPRCAAARRKPPRFLVRLSSRCAGEPEGPRITKGRSPLMFYKGLGHSKNVLSSCAWILGQHGMVVIFNVLQRRRRMSTRAGQERKGEARESLE